MEMAKISKNSKFYISPEEMVAKFPEEMVAKFKDRRNINILCFNRIMTLFFQAKETLYFLFPPIKAVCPLRKLGLLLKILKALSGEKSYENPVRAYKN